MGSDGFNEKRRHRRVRAAFIVTYRLASPIPVRMRMVERNFTAVAVDISEGGLGAVVDQEIEPNTPVRISFALVNEEPGTDREMRRWLDLEGVSLYCTYAPKAGFRAGIEFKNLPAEDREFIAHYIEARHLKKIREERPAA